jgi:uncharacterized RDD family membrane protein YckC
MKLPKLSHNKKYVNFWSRLVASMVDGFVFTLPMAAGAWWLANDASSVSEMLTAVIIFVLAFYLPTAALSMWYSPYMISRFGATLGKFLVGARVVSDAKGSFPSFKRAMLREFLGKQALFLSFGVGGLAALVHPEHQAWHDRLAGTWVKRAPGSIFLGLLALAACIAAQGWLWFQATSRVIELMK